VSAPYKGALIITLLQKALSRYSESLLSADTLGFLGGVVQSPFGGLCESSLTDSSLNSAAVRDCSHFFEIE